jgi:ubiquinone/menaquinone biosynthesis C-methylase UbiE
MRLVFRLSFISTIRFILFKNLPTGMAARAGILSYYEDLAACYDNRFNNPRLGYMRDVEKKVMLDSLQHGLILDIGCGTGEQSLFLAGEGYRVVAVDISAEMIRKACDRAEEAGLKDMPDFIIASAEALPFHEKSFDGLISIFGVFNHIPEINKAFRETHRVLKKGSRAIFTVVNRWNLTWWIYALLKLKGNWLISSLRSKEYVVNGLWTYYFSMTELERMLKSMGFKVRIGSLLILIWPFSTGKMLFFEKFFLRFEDASRWTDPFNSLGYYLLIKLEK